MGWCHEFGPDISDDCHHPMTAGESRCFCEVCGITRPGRFAGCSEVWLRGPKDTSLIARRQVATNRKPRHEAEVAPEFSEATDMDHHLDEFAVGVNAGHSGGDDRLGADAVSLAHEISH